MDTTLAVCEDVLSSGGVRLPHHFRSGGEGYLSTGPLPKDAPRSSRAIGFLTSGVVTWRLRARGTFVIRRPISQALLRAELARALPFAAEIMICQGRKIARLLSLDPFAGEPARPGVVRFVSVFAKRPRAAGPARSAKPEPSAATLPMTPPASAEWLLKILAREGWFVFGVYQRHLKVIGYLGSLDRLFGVPATTRNGNSVATIAKALGAGEV